MAATPTPKRTPNKRPDFSGNLAAAEPASACTANPAGVALAASAAAFSLPLGVAYSGGADSTALLIAAAVRWPGQVHAIHVHHGLQAAADDFVRVCEAVCAKLELPLHVVHVDARHAEGQSPEDAARKARYIALAAEAIRWELGCVLLGQHADDQVETMLLALSRGAGLPGLSAMSARFDRGGTSFFRPLLKTRSAQLRAWLVQQQISFVDDPSNTDERFTRNRIRAKLLPALEAAFPQFRETFARSADHAAQAQALLLEVAAQDLLQIGCPPAVRALQELSKMRQANLLRHWLLQQHRATPSAAQLEELLSQVAACKTRGHRIELKIGSGQVSLTGAVLHYC
jgi:tRNA(Ile)-lysidine synthase